MRISAILASAGLVVAAAVPLAALASHGKVGLWEITTEVKMPNMSANIPPEAMARRKAMGMSMPGNQTYSSQMCMTAAEVAQDRPPTTRSTKDCTMGNVKRDGHTFTADMTCSGEMQGTGHYEATYDSDEHYSGSFSFSGMAHGHPQTSTFSFDGKWISADCGSVK